MSLKDTFLNSGAYITLVQGMSLYFSAMGNPASSHLIDKINSPYDPRRGSVRNDLNCDDVHTERAGVQSKKPKVLRRHHFD